MSINITNMNKGGSYLVISPDDSEVEKIFSDLQAEMGSVDPNSVIDMDNLKKYQQQAKKLVQDLDNYEETIKSYISVYKRFNGAMESGAAAAFNKNIDEVYTRYAATAKKATLFIYEFRQWITKQEIQFVIQFQDESGELQYAQVPIYEIIPALNTFMQISTSGKFQSSRSKLQISNSVMQSIRKKFWIQNEPVLQKLRTGTRTLQRLANSTDSKKGKGTGRIFETLLENMADKEKQAFLNDIADSNSINWTSVDHIPGLRQGDLTSDIVKILIKQGILTGDGEKGFEASLKTVSKIAAHTEIQGINQIKNELFNIVAIIGKGLGKNTIQHRLFKYFTNISKSGTAYEVKKRIAKSLGEKVTEIPSKIIEKYLKI